MVKKSWFPCAAGLALAFELTVLPAAGLLAVETAPEDLLEHVSGTVAGVDPETMTVAVKTGLFGARDFLIGAETMILAGDRRMRLDELKAGDSVEVRFSAKDGQDVARTIAVRSMEKARETQALASP